MLLVKDRSTLKRVKTYLRSTTGDSRLNHLIMRMLHVYKDSTDVLTLVDAAYDFVGEKENRGTFDILKFILIVRLRGHEQNK